MLYTFTIYVFLKKIHCSPDLWLLRGRGEGEGWIRSLGLAVANDYIENG